MGWSELNLADFQKEIRRKHQYLVLFNHLRRNKLFERYKLFVQELPGSATFLCSRRKK